MSPSMNFRSDNIASVAPEIMRRMVEANVRSAGGYGADEVTGRLDRVFSDLFETPVRVYPVVTGTAANALALSVLVPPFGAVYCHRDSHVNNEECGAPEFFTGGAKLIPLPGERAKIDLGALEAALTRGGKDDVHYTQPSALSLTQQTEEGAIYGIDELQAFAECAKGHGLGLHMDGARFANAVVALDCAPADLTWRAGIDLLSFGATKNGAMAVEGVVLFKPELAEEFGYRHKRAGQLVSKMRFLSVQLEAYLADGLWLKLASNANLMARRLAQGLTALPQAELLGPVEGNELFVTLPEGMIRGLEDAGAGFYRWPESMSSSRTIRLVAAHDTTADDVEAFLQAARGAAEKAGRAASG